MDRSFRDMIPGDLVHTLFHEYATAHGMYQQSTNKQSNNNNTQNQNGCMLCQRKKEHNSQWWAKVRLWGQQSHWICHTCFLPRLYYLHNNIFYRNTAFRQGFLAYVLLPYPYTFTPILSLSLWTG